MEHVLHLVNIIIINVVSFKKWQELNGKRIPKDIKENVRVSSRVFWQGGGGYLWGRIF